MSQNKDISFKNLTKEDVPLFIKWFAQPHVNKWWPVIEKDEVVEHFLKRIRSKNVFGYIVYLGQKPIGYIQYYYVDGTGQKTEEYLPELPAGTIGTDQFIGEPDCIGKGIGTRMIKEFIAYLLTIEPTCKTIIVDPEPANYAAIRCYEKVGFAKVGEYQMNDGPCLLMQYDVKK